MPSADSFPHQPSGHLFNQSMEILASISSGKAVAAADGLAPSRDEKASAIDKDKARTRAEKAASSSALPARKVAATSSKHEEGLEETPLHLAIRSYICYVFVFMVGYIRELIWGLGPLDVTGSTSSYADKGTEGYAPLYSSFESFYTRNMFRRQKDIFFKPIASVPGAKVTVKDRESKDHFWTFKMLESGEKECTNLASYNYLGFAENDSCITEEAIASVRERGLTNCSSRMELGRSVIHKELEKAVADFQGVEDALTVGMGFATNALSIPSLVSKGCLVLSDERNHASIILGLRLSGATVRVFKHNDMKALERILKNSIVHGHPRTRRPWKKIFIFVEGVYSMEGTIVHLPEIIELKKKYGAYIYLDEAHSVGAMGPNGRGVVDYFGLDAKDVDIMMGTFTKSFGASGGYIAGSHKLISYLRIHSHASAYPVSMSPPVAQQIISSMRSIVNPDRGDGLLRVKTLARNAKYFRQRLKQLGLIVYGHDDSPVVPMMVFIPSKLRFIVNGLLERNVASVGVGFPATNITEERIRFCISASHTKQMLDEALKAIDEMAELANIKYAKSRDCFTGKEVVY